MGPVGYPVSTSFSSPGAVANKVPPLPPLTKTPAEMDVVTLAVPFALPLPQIMVKVALSRKDVGHFGPSNVMPLLIRRLVASVQPSNL